MSICKPARKAASAPQKMSKGSKPKGLGSKGKGKRTSLGTIGIIVAGVGIVYVLGTLWFAGNSRFSAPLAPSKRRTSENPERKKPPERSKPDRKRDILGVPLEAEVSETSPEATAAKHGSIEWKTLPRSLPDCIKSQAELMTVPVKWPGFHALCIDAIGEAHVSVLVHRKSGQPGAGEDEESRAMRVEGSRFPGDRPRPAMLVGALLEQLKLELEPHEFQPVDAMVSTSLYDFPPNPWALFTQVGSPIDADDDLRSLGVGGAVYLYTGGQFIWPGVRLGHKTRVPIPVTDGSSADGYKVVEMTTKSLRPLVFVLSDFLTEAECTFIKKYASSRMVPSGLAMMDSSGDSRDVRTSTQTFMERNGSPQIRALEERAHNLTRLPYDLGENIQVVRYTVGQKYGAHRDFFNPNDYHKQPQMLRSVEYGARNRLATVFWYLADVDEGGETFFPRALNEEGREYHPWNGDHEDCYRGLYVPPVRGNAVLFYSMVPDGRLDERSLHGGCKPRGTTTEKWGANQWIWNHPRRNHGTYPRKGAASSKRRAAATPGCADEDDNCAAWAASGECSKNAGFMEASCKLSCDKC